MFNPAYLPIPEHSLTVYGNSGCIARVSPRSTIKMASSPQVVSRLLRQGKFMDVENESEYTIFSCREKIFPEVYSLTPNSYTMETLNEIDWENADTVEIMTELKRKLSENLWGIPHKMTLSKSWHLTLSRYIDEKLTESAVSSKLQTRVARLVAKLQFLVDDLMVCEIHGDPTLDNCMLKVGDDAGQHELRVVDPIPFESSAMPPLRVVDLGKMLQSCLGYEWLIEKFSRNVARDQAALEAVVLDGLNSAERVAASIFAVIHIVRLLPYQFKRKEVFIRNLEEAVSYAEQASI